MGSLADLPVQILDKLGLGSILTSTLSDPPGTTQLMTRCAVITPLQSQELLGPRVFLGTEIKWRWGTSGVRGEADPSDAASSLWSFQPLPTPPTLWRSPVCCQTIWSPRGLRRSQDGSTWSLPAARRAGREDRGFLSSGKLGYGGGLPTRPQAEGGGVSQNWTACHFSLSLPSFCYRRADLNFGVTQTAGAGDDGSEVSLAFSLGSSLFTQ